MTDYSFETSVATRYADFDTYGHVNNANHATYIEEARIAYFRDVLEVERRGRGMLLVSLEIDFRQPIDADSVVVGLGVTDIGDRSFEMAYAIEAGGELCATAKTTQVAYDPDRGETIVVPDEWREAIREFEGQDFGPQT